MKNRFKETHAMVDIETLGLSTETVLLEASFVIFTMEDEPIYEEMVSAAFSFPFNVDDQLKTMRRVPDASTLLWWMTKTSPEAQKAVLNRSLANTADNSNTLSSISSALKGVEHIWCRGPHFDCALLFSLCRDYGLPELWTYWKTRDIRTQLYVLNKEDEAKKFKEDMEKSGEFVKHDSAHDVAIDAFLIATYMREHLLEQENAEKARYRQTRGRAK